ncbi:MAG: AAA family ATPase, partial [bacterium]
MNENLLRLVYDRLDLDGAADEPWAELVMAACEGAVAVEAVLDEQHGAAPLPAPAVATGDPPGVFLSSISVTGFRGVGQQATLALSAGPGLTLVVGRNGSGKSSFAEALELLLTGENKRWADRSKTWSEGWRNLHTSDACAI